MITLLYYRLFGYALYIEFKTIVNHLEDELLISKASHPLKRACNHSIVYIHY